MNVKLPLAIYGIVSGVFISSTAGFLMSVKKNAFSNIFVNFGFVLILLAISVLIYANLSYSQAQGRYMLPLISVISVNVLYGVNLFSERLKLTAYNRLIYLFIVLVMICSAVVSVFTICSFYFSDDVYL